MNTQSAPLNTVICPSSAPNPRNSQETWPMTRSPAYPSLTFLNGNAQITYWEAHKHPQADYMTHLIYRRLPIAWFYEKPTPLP